MTGHRSNKSIAEFWMSGKTIPASQIPAASAVAWLECLAKACFLNGGGDGKRFWVEVVVVVVVVVVVCFAKKQYTQMVHSF